jgi:protein Mpv17
MDGPIASATTQAVVWGALSNVFAQGYTAYRTNSLQSIDMTSFVHFLINAIIVTPPNCLWQNWLEDTFPTTVGETPSENRKSDGKLDKKQLSIKNTIAKFFLDQTLGCWTNTLMFIMVMGLLKGRSTDAIMFTIHNDFWSMVFASYRLWPLVCLLNLVVVPFDYRMLVGNTAGFGWGVYMSLTAA